MKLGNRSSLTHDALHSMHSSAGTSALPSAGRALQEGRKKRIFRDFTSKPILDAELILIHKSSKRTQCDIQFWWTDRQWGLNVCIKESESRYVFQTSSSWGHSCQKFSSHFFIQVVLACPSVDHLSVCRPNSSTNALLSMNSIFRARPGWNIPCFSLKSLKKFLFVQIFPT